MKFDGYRAQIAIQGADVRVYTRNGHDWTEQFKVILQPLRKLTKGSALIDGEIVAIDRNVVPLVPQAAWPEVKSFCQDFAEMLGRTDPQRFIANMSKARRKGRMFIDYLRNGQAVLGPHAHAPAVQWLYRWGGTNC